MTGGLFQLLSLACSWRTVEPVTQQLKLARFWSLQASAVNQECIIWKPGSFHVHFERLSNHSMMTTFWLPSHSGGMQGHNHTSSKCSRSSGTSDLHKSFLVGWCLGKGQMFLFRPAAQMEIALRTPKVAYHLYTVNLCTYTWDRQKSSYVLGC